MEREHYFRIVTTTNICQGEKGKRSANTKTGHMHIFFVDTSLFFPFCIAALRVCVCVYVARSYYFLVRLRE